MAHLLININIMSVLILKNIPAEGPGTIEDFLCVQGIPYRVVDLQAEAIPDPGEYQTLVMMGGPMSVNDDIPYIRREEELVREFIGAGKQVFGVCLGAQIMARALGARVYAGPEKEIGWFDIVLTEEGIRDPLMRRLATHPRAGDFWKSFKVFHWHGETFDIPAGAERLAKSSLYTNQAFRYGPNAYAFQFHIEVRREMITEWLENEPVDLEEVRRKTDLFYEEYAGRAVHFYAAFFQAHPNRRQSAA